MNFYHKLFVIAYNDCIAFWEFSNSKNPKYEEILLFENLLINWFLIKQTIRRPDSLELI